MADINTFIQCEQHSVYGCFFDHDLRGHCIFYLEA